MIVEDLIGAAAVLGASAIFLSAMVLGLIELIGKIYGTFRCLVRNDLSSEQRIIYLLLIWFIPLGWLVYFLLGTDRTQRLFSEVDIF